MDSATRYAIGDLARLAGVSRRTVRYYVQEGLIPPPLGVGRGNHYTSDHLDEILRVKALQEAGRSLEDIKRSSKAAAGDSPHAARAIQRSVWRRLTLIPGVELHVAEGVRLPAPGRLQELAGWCERYLASPMPESEQDDEQ